ncbi:MAG: uL22 family ribosomal protein [Candidatus Shapirobacteria bacterium]|jgi:large subunit ribosomal protein L22
MAQIIKKTIIKTPIEKKNLSKVKEKPVEVKSEEKIETVFKTAKYVNKNIQISPRKLRLMVDEVRKFTPNEALNRIKFINTKAARILVQALKNVIADAKNNFNLDTNSLKFDTIKADEALKIKRMDKSHGSHFARGLIQKRHSRLVVIIKGVQK